MRYCVRASNNFQWLKDRLGQNFHYSPDARAIEAFDEKTGRVVGMVAFDGWTTTMVQLSIAMDSPIAWRSLQKAAFEYPFNEAHKQVLLAMVASNNLRSLRLTSRVGFRQTYKIADGVSPGVDYVLFEMRRSDCPQLR